MIHKNYFHKYKNQNLLKRNQILSILINKIKTTEYEKYILVFIRRDDYTLPVSHRQRLKIYYTILGENLTLGTFRRLVLYFIIQGNKSVAFRKLSLPSNISYVNIRHQLQALGIEETIFIETLVT